MPHTTLTPYVSLEGDWSLRFDDPDLSLNDGREALRKPLPTIDFPVTRVRPDGYIVEYAGSVKFNGIRATLAQRVTGAHEMPAFVSMTLDLPATMATGLGEASHPQEAWARFQAWPTCSSHEEEVALGMLAKALVKRIGTEKQELTIDPNDTDILKGIGHSVTFKAEPRGDGTFKAPGSYSLAKSAAADLLERQVDSAQATGERPPQFSHCHVDVKLQNILARPTLPTYKLRFRSKSNSQTGDGDTEDTQSRTDEPLLRTYVKSTLSGSGPYSPSIFTNKARFSGASEQVSIIEVLPDGEEVEFPAMVQLDVVSKTGKDYLNIGEGWLSASPLNAAPNHEDYDPVASLGVALARSMSEELLSKSEGHTVDLADALSQWRTPGGLADLSLVRTGANTFALNPVDGREHLIEGHQYGKVTLTGGKECASTSYELKLDSLSASTISKDN